MFYSCAKSISIKKKQTLPTEKFLSRTTQEQWSSFMGIKTLLPFLKNITEESNLDHFQDLIAAVDASCWLHKSI